MATPPTGTSIPTDVEIISASDLVPFEKISFPVHPQLFLLMYPFYLQKVSSGDVIVESLNLPVEGRPLTAPRSHRDGMTSEALDHPNYHVVMCQSNNLHDFVTYQYDAGDGASDSAPAAKFLHCLNGNANLRLRSASVRNYLSAKNQTVSIDVSRLPVTFDMTEDGIEEMMVELGLVSSEHLEPRGVEETEMETYLRVVRNVFTLLSIIGNEFSNLSDESSWERFYLFSKRCSEKDATQHGLAERRLLHLDNHEFGATGNCRLSKPLCAIVYFQSSIGGIVRGIIDGQHGQCLTLLKRCHLQTQTVGDDKFKRLCSLGDSANLERRTWRNGDALSGHNQIRPPRGAPQLAMVVAYVPKCDDGVGNAVESPPPIDDVFSKLIPNAHKASDDMFGAHRINLVDIEYPNHLNRVQDSLNENDNVGVHSLIKNPSDCIKRAFRLKKDDLVTKRQKKTILNEALCMRYGALTKGVVAAFMDPPTDPEQAPLTYVSGAALGATISDGDVLGMSQVFDESVMETSSKCNRSYFVFSLLRHLSDTGMRNVSPDVAPMLTNLFQKRGPVVPHVFALDVVAMDERTYADFLELVNMSYQGHAWSDVTEGDARRTTIYDEGVFRDIQKSAIALHASLEHYLPQAMVGALLRKQASQTKKKLVPAKIKSQMDNSFDVKLLLYMLKCFVGKGIVNFLKVFGPTDQQAWYYITNERVYRSSSITVEGRFAKNTNKITSSCAGENAAEILITSSTLRLLIDTVAHANSVSQGKIVDSLATFLEPYICVGVTERRAYGFDQSHLFDQDHSASWPGDLFVELLRSRYRQASDFRYQDSMASNFPVLLKISPPVTHSGRVVNVPGASGELEKSYLHHGVGGWPRDTVSGIASVFAAYFNLCSAKTGGSGRLASWIEPQHAKTAETQADSGPDPASADGSSTGNACGARWNAIEEGDEVLCFMFWERALHRDDHADFVSFKAAKSGGGGSLVVSGSVTITCYERTSEPEVRDFLDKVVIPEMRNNHVTWGGARGKIGFVSLGNDGQNVGEVVGAGEGLSVAVIRRQQARNHLGVVLSLYELLTYLFPPNTEDAVQGDGAETGNLCREESYPTDDDGLANAIGVARTLRSHYLASHHRQEEVEGEEKRLKQFLLTIFKLISCRLKDEEDAADTNEVAGNGDGGTDVTPREPNDTVRITEDGEAGSAPPASNSAFSALGAARVVHSNPDTPYQVLDTAGMFVCDYGAQCYSDPSGHELTGSDMPWCRNFSNLPMIFDAKRKNYVVVCLSTKRGGGDSLAGDETMLLLGEIEGWRPAPTTWTDRREERGKMVPGDSNPSNLFWSFPTAGRAYRSPSLLDAEHTWGDEMSVLVRVSVPSGVQVNCAENQEPKISKRSGRHTYVQLSVGTVMTRLIPLESDRNMSVFGDMINAPEGTFRSIENLVPVRELLEAFLSLPDLFDKNDMLGEHFVSPLYAAEFFGRVRDSFLEKCGLTSDVVEERVTCWTKTDGRSPSIEAAVIPFMGLTFAFSKVVEELKRQRITEGAMRELIGFVRLLVGARSSLKEVSSEVSEDDQRTLVIDVMREVCKDATFEDTCGIAEGGSPSASDTSVGGEKREDKASGDNNGSDDEQGDLDDDDDASGGTATKSGAVSDDGDISRTRSVFRRDQSRNFDALRQCISVFRMISKRRELPGLLHPGNPRSSSLIAALNLIADIGEEGERIAGSDKVRAVLARLDPQTSKERWWEELERTDIIGPPQSGGTEGAVHPSSWDVDNVDLDEAEPRCCGVVNSKGGFAGRGVIHSLATALDKREEMQRLVTDESDGGLANMLHAKGDRHGIRRNGSGAYQIEVEGKNKLFLSLSEASRRIYDELSEKPRVSDDGDSKYNDEHVIASLIRVANHDLGRRIELVADITEGGGKFDHHFLMRKQVILVSDSATDTIIHPKSCGIVVGGGLEDEAGEGGVDEQPFQGLPHVDIPRDDDKNVAMTVALNSNYTHPFKAKVGWKWILTKEEFLRQVSMIAGCAEDAGDDGNDSNFRMTTDEKNRLMKFWVDIDDDTKKGYESLLGFPPEAENGFSMTPMSEATVEAGSWSFSAGGSIHVGLRAPNSLGAFGRCTMFLSFARCNELGIVHRSTHGRETDTQNTDDFDTQRTVLSVVLNLFVDLYTICGLDIDTTLQTSTGIRKLAVRILNNFRKRCSAERRVVKRDLLIAAADMIGMNQADKSIVEYLFAKEQGAEERDGTDPGDFCGDLCSKEIEQYRNHQRVVTKEWATATKKAEEQARSAGTPVVSGVSVPGGDTAGPPGEEELAVDATKSVLRNPESESGAENGGEAVAPADSPKKQAGDGNGDVDGSEAGDQRFGENGGEAVAPADSPKKQAGDGNGDVGGSGAGDQREGENGGEAVAPADSPKKQAGDGNGDVGGGGAGDQREGGAPGLGNSGRVSSSGDGGEAAASADGPNKQAGEGDGAVDGSDAGDQRGGDATGLGNSGRVSSPGDGGGRAASADGPNKQAGDGNVAVDKSDAGDQRGGDATGLGNSGSVSSSGDGGGAAASADGPNKQDGDGTPEQDKVVAPEDGLEAEVSTCGAKKRKRTAEHDGVQQQRGSTSKRNVGGTPPLQSDKNRSAQVSSDPNHADPNASDAGSQLSAVTTTPATEKTGGSADVGEKSAVVASSLSPSREGPTTRHETPNKRKAATQEATADDTESKLPIEIVNDCCVIDLTTPKKGKRKATPVATRRSPRTASANSRTGGGGAETLGASTTGVDETKKAEEDDDYKGVHFVQMLLPKKMEAKERKKLLDELREVAMKFDKKNN